MFHRASGFASSVFLVPPLLKSDVPSNAMATRPGVPATTSGKITAPRSGGVMSTSGLNSVPGRPPSFGLFALASMKETL